MANLRRTPKYLKEIGERKVVTFKMEKLSLPKVKRAFKGIGRGRL